MTHTARALYDFFNGFGIPAYLRESIPRDAVRPYITYELVEPEPLTKAMIHAWVWYQDTSVNAISEKCDQIKQAIGTGLTIPAGNGFVALFRDKDTPFAQLVPSQNNDDKGMYLTMIIHANTD